MMSPHTGEGGYNFGSIKTMKYGELPSWGHYTAVVLTGILSSVYVTTPIRVFLFSGSPDRIVLSDSNIDKICSPGPLVRPLQSPVGRRESLLHGVIGGYCMEYSTYDNVSQVCKSFL